MIPEQHYDKIRDLGYVMWDNCVDDIEYETMMSNVYRAIREDPPRDTEWEYIVQLYYRRRDIWLRDGRETINVGFRG